jgi:uncharacterized protein
METRGFYYREYRQGRRFLIKIRPGESIIESIKSIARAESIRCAVVLSAIGSVKNVRLNDIKSGAKLPITAARLTPHSIEGPLELLALTGNFVEGGAGGANCHLHVMASKSSGDVVGGHMQEAEVFATCEIVLAEILVDGVERHPSASGGTPTLFFSGEE